MKALILVNVGTPEKPSRREVKKFLSSFLNDKRVINLPYFFRKILVNLIIVPFRSSHSTKLYKKIWTNNGSPLLMHMEQLVENIHQNSEMEFLVYGTMRYGEPSLEKLLNNLKDKAFEEIIIFPLYPQYASSTSGSVIDLVMNNIKNWPTIPNLKFQGQFYNNQYFISCFVSKIKEYDYSNYDHILFSYHGLPINHIDASHPGFSENNCTCQDRLPPHGMHCYKATCYETSRLLAKELNLKNSQYSTGFQSRLSNKWLSPFTDNLIKSLPSKGVKKLLVVAPSFVADCLETLYEINIEYRNLFLDSGGEKFEMVESLNSSAQWAKAIINISKIR